MCEVELVICCDELIVYMYVFGGFNLYGEGLNGGMIFVMLKNWKECKVECDYV